VDAHVSGFCRQSDRNVFDPARVYDAFRSGKDFKTLQTAVRAGAYLPNPIPSIGLPNPIPSIGLPMP
jgi:hypothetical protein